ncbi:MAG: DNA adenine methylase [Candidatus Hodarchaeales archaeon]
MLSQKKLSNNTKNSGTLFRQFPQTRYQGSKLKLLSWLKEVFNSLSFDTVLDGFSGTGVVSYLLKNLKKNVTSNDILASNHIIAQALVVNQTETLTQRKIKYLMNNHKGLSYDSLIQDVFEEIYFIPEENLWLDRVVQNLHNTDLSVFEKSIAFYGLFQACLIKRPYNLFHRANLYMRIATVSRSFGNKVTWDRSFEEYFPLFINQANQAIINIGEGHRAFNRDIFNLDTDYDLVYLDPPYLNLRGIGANYRSFYHFLEGLINYGDNWKSKIDYKTKNRRLKSIYNPWNDPKANLDCFERLFKKFRNSIIVLSYRDPGLPSIQLLQSLLESYKKKVNLFTKPYNYALSIPKNKGQEIILIGTD